MGVLFAGAPSALAQLPTTLADPAEVTVGAGITEATCHGNWASVEAPENHAGPSQGHAARQPHSQEGVAFNVTNATMHPLPGEWVSWQVLCHVSGIEAWATGRGGIQRQVVLQNWLPSEMRYQDVASCEYDGIEESACDQPVEVRLNASLRSDPLHHIAPTSEPLPSEATVCLVAPVRGVNQPQHGVVRDVSSSTMAIPPGDICLHGISIDWMSFHGGSKQEPWPTTGVVGVSVLGLLVVGMALAKMRK